MADMAAVVAPEAAIVHEAGAIIMRLDWAMAFPQFGRWRLAPAGLAQGGSPKGGAQPRTRGEALQLCPLRNPALAFYEENDHVILHFKRRRNRFTWLTNLVLPLPDEKKVELDTMGSQVWRMLDGQTSISNISRALASKYRLAPREAELSLQDYLKLLSRRGYIVFLQPAAIQTPGTATGDRVAATGDRVAAGGVPVAATEPPVTRKKRS